MFLAQKVCLVLAAVGAVSGRWTYQESVVRREGQQPRAVTATNASAPIVDLGYAKYQGVFNATFNNSLVYKGVRFAAPPRRWQLPQWPQKSNESVIHALLDPPRCPQSPPGASNPSTYNYAASAYGDEDCLFLNVYTRPEKKNLPVFVWIHGGGYGLGSAADFDLSYMNRVTGDKFMFVAIQYRLGAFGFASSAEIARFGVPNAGAHDMHFALEWVQKYIHLFGGDPAQVTIGGESAGGGSVMMMAMANGGEDGTKLWKRGIASSPYLPTQWAYDDIQPSQSYYDFAKRAGCLTDAVTANGTVFTCLQAADSRTLQKASADAGLWSHFGQWAFIPVTDGKLIRQRPTEQLLRGKVNGERMLAGNNANEGNYFVRQNIATEAAFRQWLVYDYPLLSEADVAQVLQLYRLPEGTPASGGPRFDSNGLTPPFATAVSNHTSGWQQAANNLYAETTFVCPAYWLAAAYSGDINANGRAKRAWRYQYSVPNAFHGTDMAPLLDDSATANPGKMNVGFRTAFQTIWANFIASGDPTLGLSGSVRGLVDGDDVAAASTATWGPWTKGGAMLNLNVTNSVPYRARFNVVDGDKWEGGRGERCALWAKLGAIANL